MRLRCGRTKSGIIESVEILADCMWGIFRSDSFGVLFCLGGRVLPVGVHFDQTGINRKPQTANRKPALLPSPCSMQRATLCPNKCRSKSLSRKPPCTCPAGDACIAERGGSWKRLNGLEQDQQDQDGKTSDTPSSDTPPHIACVRSACQGNSPPRACGSSVLDRRMAAPACCQKA